MCVSDSWMPGFLFLHVPDIPSYRSAVATAQKWLAHEFRASHGVGYASDELSEVFDSLIPLLEESLFAAEIDSRVFEFAAALNLAGGDCRHIFIYRSRIEHDFDFQSRPPGFGFVRVALGLNR